jgi:hypothetical protein
MANCAICAVNSTRSSPLPITAPASRRICGGPVLAAANSDQITARIKAVRSLRA